MKRIFSAFLCSVMMMLIMLSSTYQIKANAASESSLAGIVTTLSTSLNVRSSASSASSVRTEFKKGSYVTLMSKSGSWWKVEYAKGVYGYCSSDYITQLNSTPAKVSVSSYLNVRTRAGTSYPVQGTIANGTTVLILMENASWAKVLYNGTSTGYVSLSYLSKYSQKPVSSSSGTKLSVPDFKQTDSRWSGKYLGSSGKTIGQIGCTTTCIAMTESFRTKTTVYPNTMASRLSYSSSGSLYWPSNYVTTTSVSFAAIASVLKQGKPVIVGLKTSAGGTHWVVVTGYNGIASSKGTFYINDPATASRTTLAEVLSKYPYFYKMAYYK